MSGECVRVHYKAETRPYTPLGGVSTISNYNKMEGHTLVYLFTDLGPLNDFLNQVSGLKTDV